jgi:hypothetical protein
MGGLIRLSSAVLAVTRGIGCGRFKIPGHAFGFSDEVEVLLLSLPGVALRREDCSAEVP